MSDDEKAFLRAVAEQQEAKPKRWPRDVIAATGINHKRAWYLLQKWADKGWYDWGVTIDLGWLTVEGVAAARWEATDE